MPFYSHEQQNQAGQYCAQFPFVLLCWQSPEIIATEMGDSRTETKERAEKSPDKNTSLVDLLPNSLPAVLELRNFACGLCLFFPTLKGNLE